MDPAVDAFLSSWPLDPWLIAGLLLVAGIYLRGWRSLCERVGGRWHGWHLTAFFGGLAVLLLAFNSPIETYAPLLLQVHMAQHLLLMMAAPPLLWLGEPLIPLLRGLPAPVRTYWVAPLFRSRFIRRAFEVLTHPAGALLLFTGTSWIWHWPPMYEAALRSSDWHYLQHVCFLVAGLLFWYPVVRPFPSRPRWSPWLLIPFLILADVQNTVLSALLTFSNRVIYPYYEEMPRLNGLSALSDQAAAGVLMWVPGSIAYLLPLFVIGLRTLYGTTSGQSVRGIRARGVARPPLWMSMSSERSRTWPRKAVAMPPRPGISPEVTMPPGVGMSSDALARPIAGRLALPLVSNPRGRTSFDLLRVPVAGRVLQSGKTRLVLRVLMLLLAGAVILDGLTGPQVGAMNLAGVLPWVHWRGLLIFGLLSAGNVFCFACPFTLPRSLARSWLGTHRAWPRFLRSKWLAVGLLVAFFWAYETFSLWDSPWWTAWIAIGYFVVAFVVDTFFRGAAFCKYVCPIGQFNFVQSLVSPLEVKVRDASVCATCQTHDCIQGGDGLPGCGTGLFQPRKAGNLDCTFCLDCVRACPHDNVGVLAVRPGAELWRDTLRSGIGRLARRPDMAALAVVLVFGAFVNAAGMVTPVQEMLDRLGSMFEPASPLFATALLYVTGLGVAPVLSIAAATTVSRRWGQLRESIKEVAAGFVFALVPLGFAMWLAHYGFHLLTGYDAAIPAAQRFVSDWGWPAADDPDWIYACCKPVRAWLSRTEILSLDIGLLLSLYSGYRIALERSSRPLRTLAPWALLMVALFAVGVWTVLQPMQMRGTLPAGR